jgi:hypothetical protein
VTIWRPPVTGESLHAVIGAEQQNISAAPRKQSVGDHAGDLVERASSSSGFSILRLHDEYVAAVGGKALPQRRLAAEPDELAAT